MSFLLRKIKDENRDAAKVLEAAGLRTDSEILTLTREDLHELFPGRQAFKLRRTLYDVIHERPIAEQLLKKLKGFLPRDSFMAALTNNGVLVDYLQILKDTKTQVNSIQSFLDAHIGLLEEFSADQPDSGQTDGCSQEAGGLGTSDANGPSSKQIAPTGPQEPQKSFSDLSASPPGGQRDGFEHGAGGLGTSDAFGQNSKQIAPPGPQEPLKHRSGVSASPPGGQRDGFQYGAGGFGTSDAIGRNMKQIVPPGHQESLKDRSGASASPPGGQRDGFQYGAGGEPFEMLSVPDVLEPTLLYKMVVGGGKTFGNDLKLMQKVKKPFQDRLRPCVGAQDNKITFVFCPISSRVGTDVDAAMVDIKDDKPIVLVLMHHTHEVKPVSSMKIKPDDARVVLHVNVFYHETCGLLKCDQNDAAVTEIQKKLEESFIQRSYGRGGYKSADGNYNKLNPRNW